jgi:hypothetical protein
VNERRYTLTEAKVELARAECRDHGHSYEIRTVFGTNEPIEVLCSRCGRRWGIEQLRP